MGNCSVSQVPAPRSCRFIGALGSGREARNCFPNFHHRQPFACILHRRAWHLANKRSALFEISLVLLGLIDCATVGGPRFIGGKTSESKTLMFPPRWILGSTVGKSASERNGRSGSKTDPAGASRRVPDEYPNGTSLNGSSDLSIASIVLIKRA